MSEEKIQEAQEQAQAGKVVKMSELLGQQRSGAPSPAAEIQAQIANNQELYTTLSRSLLELHNDIRQFRQKSEGMDRVVFNLQQSLNKVYAEVSERIRLLEEAVAKLTDLWNEAVQETEMQDAADKEGEENQEGDGEDLREEEG